MHEKVEAEGCSGAGRAGLCRQGRGNEKARLLLDGRSNDAAGAIAGKIARSTVGVLSSRHDATGGRQGGEAMNRRRMVRAAATHPRSLWSGAAIRIVPTPRR